MIETTTLYSSEKPLVSICCSTYNHEKYIGEALDGFLIQKCNFPVEILINDDCSTDNTADIIKEYQNKFPGLIKPVFQEENQYSKGFKPISHFLLPRATGKYIALCEGDDYWTDPFKLQKQVDFLESNPDYNLCVGGFKKVYTQKKQSTISIKTPPGINHQQKGFSFGLNDQKKDRYTKILTAVFRNDRGSFRNLTKYKYGVDVHIFYHLLKTGKAFYITENMGVYRIHEGGVFSMNHGKINNNGAYNVFKELFQINRDEYSRYNYIRAAAALFRYNLYHRYSGNTFKKKIKLYFEILLLLRNYKDFTFLFTVFIPTLTIVKLKKIESENSHLSSYLMLRKI